MDSPGLLKVSSSLNEKDERRGITSVDQLTPSPAELSNDKDTELLSPELRCVAERELVRKLDIRLLPTIVLVFILNYIDVSVFLSSHSQKN